MQTALPFRQIHLDFHTSEAIDGIGADFDPEQFAETLAQAHVNSINVFALCHHGWLYYDTEAFAAYRHPFLETNLLKDQIAACHAHDIAAPIYVSVQRNQQIMEEHPEWRVLGADGHLFGPGPYEDGFRHLLCLNTPYVAWLKDVVSDVMSSVPVDGFWFDIVDARDCSCHYCRQGMFAQGMEPSNAEERMVYARQVLSAFVHDMSAHVRATKPDALIFYNAGHAGPHHRPILDAFTHLELESLPSGGWGYLHFPIAARFVRTLGVDYLGMTGKFHTSWGDFHSYKNEAALAFECYHMLALNAKVCVGDQLHPRGVLEPATYDLIGKVYEQVEAKEAWCIGVEPLVDIGVLTPEEFDPALNRVGVDFRPMMGVVRMLQEGKHQFDMVDSQSDFGHYRVLVLPDKVPVEASTDEGALAAKLQAYVDGGGAVIASFASGMDAAQTAFTWDALGVTLTGEGPRDPSGTLARGREYAAHNYADYLLPHEGLGKGLPATEHVMTMRGMAIAAAPGTEVLADVVAPYFDRTYRHFCSHRQAPSSGQVSQPGVVQNGRVIYFSHPIFSQYQIKAPRWCRVLFLNALERLLPDPLVRVEGPTAAIATLNRQVSHARDVLHLLHYVPERRGEAFDVVEDVVPLYGVRVSVKTDGPVARVTLVPQGEVLSFDQQDGRVVFTVPKVEGHQMVEIA